MDNLSPTGQLRPNSGLSRLLNNYGFLNFGQVNRDPAAIIDPPAGDPPPVVDPPPVKVDPPPAASWKGFLRNDLKESPLLTKFEDNPDGLNKAVESHANLEKLLGNEKIPIPKDANDKEGWARLNKALGVPEKPDGYALPDVKLPESMKNMAFDKARFAEAMLKTNATPTQANALYKMYTDMQLASYNQHMEALQKNLDTMVTALKTEWGPAYNTNVELGQSVISQFSGDKETEAFLTAALSGDPRGVKFLKKLGDQFAENKVGDFNVKRFAVSPEEAQAEIDKMTRDLEGPYMDTKNKFTPKERQVAIDRMNTLRGVIHRSKG